MLQNTNWSHSQIKPRSHEGVRDGRLQLWPLALAATLAYPLFLRSAYASALLWTSSGATIEHAASIFGFLASLLAAYAAPALSAAAAFQLGSLADPTERTTRILRIVHLGFASPPLFTGIGVAAFLLKLGPVDIPVWMATWTTLALYALAKPAQRATVAQKPHAALRTFHGVAALGILAIFLLAHIANHLLAVWTINLHDRARRVLEELYRAPIVEPLLVLLFVALIASGLAMALRYTGAQQDRFRTLQTLTGVYIGVFVASHLTAIFVMARWVEHVPSDWAFASGAPIGLIRDPWNVRLITHYSIAVWAVATHVGLGVRGVLRAHGVGRAADILARSASFGGLAASAIITLALVGLHLGSMR